MDRRVNLAPRTGIQFARKKQILIFLKIFATTGTASDLSGEQVYFYPEISAATKVAHANGPKVALHAYGASAVPEAIRAGVDSIEHAVDVDDETLAAWAASGIAYVPTIDHNRYYADYREEYGFDPQAERELRDFTPATSRCCAAPTPRVFPLSWVQTPS